MNVSLQNIDKVSALLTVKLEKADYQEKVDKSLKSLRQFSGLFHFKPIGVALLKYAKIALRTTNNNPLPTTLPTTVGREDILNLYERYRFTA